MMGGVGAHEYMAPCAAGENDVALSDAGYAANVEIATATPAPADGLPEPLAAPEPVGNARREDGGRRDRPVRRSRARPDQGDARDQGRRLAAAVLVRGDHSLNEFKLANHLGGPARLATEDEIRDRFGAPPGFIGPVGASVPILADEALRGLAGLDRRRQRARPPPARRRHRIATSTPTGPTCARSRRGTRARTAGVIRIEPAIEVGNIFKLGTRYSRTLRRDVPRREQQGAPHLDGLLRHRTGPDRRRGRSSSSPTSRASRGRGRWRRSTSSSSRSARRGRRPASSPTASTRSCARPALDVLYDDRDIGPGAKFADAELLGVPLRLTVGKRGIEQGEIETQVRRGQEKGVAPARRRGRGGRQSCGADFPDQEAA